MLQYMNIFLGFRPITDKLEKDFVTSEKKKKYKVKIVNKTIKQLRGHEGYDTGANMKGKEKEWPTKIDFNQRARPDKE